jgi:hypothetical protein
MEQPNDPPGDVNLLARILIWIAGAPEQVLRQSPARDFTPIRATAWLMIATLLYQAMLFTLIGEELFDPQRKMLPVILLAALSLSTFICLIDRYAVVVSGFHHEGLTELARAGIDVRGGSFARFKLAFFLIARIGVLSVGLALLCGLFVSLLIFWGDIHSKLEHEFQQNNAALIVEETTIIDSQIKRIGNAVRDQTTQVDVLSRQTDALRQTAIDPVAGNTAIQQAEREVQNLLDQRQKVEQEIQTDQTYAANEIGGIRGVGNSGKPGYGLRWRAAMQKVADAKTHLQSLDQQLANARARLDALRTGASSGKDAATRQAKDQLPHFEESLKAETAKLTGTKDELTKLIAGRDLAIRQAVEDAPNYVGYDNGLVAQISVLEALASKDRKIAILIMLVDVVSFGLELAAVLSRVTGYAPTTFAVLLARDVYLSAVRIADEMMEELDQRNGEEPDESGLPAPAGPVDGTPGSGGAAIPDPAMSTGEAALRSEPPESPVAAAPASPRPPKRGRGRPRIHPIETHPPRRRSAQKHSPLTVITGGIEQGQQGQPSEPPMPA